MPDKRFNNEDRLRNKLQGRFANYEQPARKDFWSEIEKDLPAKKTNSRRRVFGFIASGAAAMLIVAVVFAVPQVRDFIENSFQSITNTKPEKNTTTQPIDKGTSSEINNIDSTEIYNHSIESVSNEAHEKIESEATKESSKSVPESENDVKKENNDVKKVVENTNNASANKNEKKANSKLGTKNNTNKTTNNKKESSNKASKSKNVDKAVESTVEANVNQTSKSGVEWDKSASEPTTTNNDGAATAAENQNVSVDSIAEKTVDINEKVKGIEEPTVEEIELKGERKPFFLLNKGLSVSIYTGNISLFHSRKNNIPLYNPSDTASSTDIGKGRTEYSRPIQYGIGIRKDFSNYFAIETGMKYTYLYSRLLMEYRTKPLETASTTKAHYIGIPLKAIGTFYNNERYSVYATLGVMGEKCISGSTKYTNGNVLALTTNGWQWSASTSVGLGYKPSERFSIFIEPQLNYYFKLDKLETIRKEEKYDFTINGGVRIFF